MGGLSIWHWLIVLAVVLLLFGTSKVSNLMGEFGKGIKTFKQNIAEDDDEKKAKDAAMSGGSIGGPVPDATGTTQSKSTVNQG